MHCGRSDPHNAMIRIIHAADLHLDSPFESLDAEKASVRRSEQRALLERIAAEVNQRNADLLFLAGDLLDSGSAYAETGEALLAALGKVRVPVFIAPGNHDWYSRRSPYALLPFSDNVHIFRTPRLESVCLPELGARVWGAGYTSPSCEALLRGFHAPAEEDVTQLLVLHAEPGRAGSPYCPVTEEELSQSGMRYAALGHIHLGSGLRRAGSCFYAWPGCPEGRGFDECGEKGILQIDIDGETVKAGFIPTAARRYEKLRVEPGADALAAIRAALPKDTADDVYKIILTGESFAAPDLAYLRQALERDFFALTFSDETVPPRDLWRRAGEDSLAGRFLRRMQRRIEAAQTEEEKKLLLRAVRCGIAALEGWEVRL